MKKKEIQKIDALLTEIIEKAKEIKSLLNDEEKIIEKAKEVKSLLNDEGKAASEEVLGKAEAKTVKLTLEDVRKVLTEKSRAGKTSDVKALLKKHGSNKLSEVNPDDYEELLKEAEGL